MTHEGAPALIDPVPWDDAPAGPLADGEIELVLAPHHAPVALMPALTAMLTPDERAAAGRHGKPAARDQAILSRATLRLLLARYLRIAPQDLNVAVDAHGKPFLRDSDISGHPLAFSLSHAGGLLLFGFSRAPIGVDLEPLEPIPRLDAFVRMTFSERERAIHAALPADQRPGHAYRVWVGKEAVVKRSGEGIRRDFASFDLAEEDVTTFAPRDGFVAAVAGRGTATLRFRRVADVALLLSDVDATSRR